MPFLTAKLFAGAASGFIATIPMTAVMVAFFRRLPWCQRHAPPPHQVAMELADAVGIKRHLDVDERVALTAASHFGYGAAMGTVYAATADSFPGSPAARGAAFGLAVWSASYLGWLPAIDFRAPAGQQSFERNCMMVVAHLVFGASLGVLHDQCTRGKGQTSTRRQDRRASSRLARP